MFDVGFSEIMLTSAIALVVLGPERLPKVARQVGNWMGRARAMARQLSEQLEREVNAEEILRQQKKLAASFSLDTPTAPDRRIGPPPTPEPTPATPTPDPPRRDTSPAAMHAHDPKPEVAPVTDTTQQHHE